MKNKNPYLSCIILWIVAICVALSFSIYGIVSGNLFLAISQLVFIVFDSIYLGWCIRKFNDYKELLKTKNALEDGLKQFEELMKMKENEPIKVVIDGNEYNFENYSFKWEGKPYIKEPTRNNNVKFDNLVPYKDNFGDNNEQ